MKLKLIIALFIFTGCSGAMAQFRGADSVLRAEREFYYKRYLNMSDTMKLNTWKNLKRKADILKLVVEKDQQVIDKLELQINSDSAANHIAGDISQKYMELSADYSKSRERSKHNALIIQYLKSALVALLFLFVVLFYSRYLRTKRMRIYKNDSYHYKSLVDERQKQLDLMDAELRKQKQREMEFRDELEKGMQIHQERLNVLQQKSDQLEKLNKQLTSSLPDEIKSTLPISSDNNILHELPDDIDELKKLAKSLYDERNSLMNLAGKLRTRVEEENIRNQAIVEKIKFLANDLSAE